MVGGGQTADDFLEHSLIFANQAALDSAFLAAAKDVERCAAQSSQLCQNAENGDHPGSVDAFAQISALRIAVGKQRRGQEERHGRGVFDAVRDPATEMTLNSIARSRASADNGTAPRW